MACGNCDSTKPYGEFTPSARSIAEWAVNEALENKAGLRPHNQVCKPEAMVCYDCAEWREGETGRAYLLRLHKVVEVRAGWQFRLDAPNLSVRLEKGVHWYNPLHVADNGADTEAFLENWAERCFWSFWNLNSFEEFLNHYPRSAREWLNMRKGMPPMLEISSDEEDK